MAFLFRDNQRQGKDGWMDSMTDEQGATLNAVP